MPSKARLLSTYGSTDVTQAEFNLLDDFTSTIHSSLPVATTSSLGAVKVGNNLSINSSTGVMSATDTTYVDGTTSASGLMSSADKVRLNNMEDNANNYSLPTATSTTIGGFKIGTNLSIDSNDALNVSGGVTTVVTDTINVVSGMTITGVANSTDPFSTIPDVNGVRKSPEIYLAYTSSVSKLILFFDAGSHTMTAGTDTGIRLQLAYSTNPQNAWSDSQKGWLNNAGMVTDITTAPISVHWSGSIPSWGSNGVRIRPMFRLVGSGKTRSFDVGGSLTLTALFY